MTEQKIFTSDSAKNNKRILKNTLLLYLRMFFVMFITFFTTREILVALGAEDFGLVNVIGGIASIFTFLSSTLSASSSRYFNFDLGKNDFVNLKKTFSLFVILYGALVILVFLLAETVGLYVLKNTVIPAGKETAVFYFFQFSVLTALLGIATLPYSALIISYEKMGVFAFITAFEAILKLGIVYLLYLDYFTRLEFYGFLLLLVGVFHFLFYFVYCQIKFPESHFKFVWDFPKMKELVVFGIWSLWGGLAGLFGNTLLNVLLNNFFGAVVNSARAIAMQISVGASSFTQNFLTAVRPQIVKYWAQEEYEKCFKLVFFSSRIGFFLVFVFACPLILEANFVLNLWLKEVPEYAVLFCKLTLVQISIDSFSYPLIQLAIATGKIALYQTVVGFCLILVLPVSYLAFKFGAPPESYIYITIAIFVLSLCLRLLILRKIAKFPVSKFISILLLKSSVYAALAFIFTFALKLFTQESWLSFFTISFFGVFFVFFFAYFIGFAKEERVMIFGRLKSKFLKR